MEQYINNNYFYYDHWWQDDKEPQDKLAISEAKKRFEDSNPIGNTFYILVGDEKKPSYIINYVCFDFVTICKLNDNLDYCIELSYQILETIDENKFFLTTILINKMDGTKQIKNKAIGFAKVDYNDGNHIWSIHKAPYYEITDYIKDETTTGFYDKKIFEEEFLWKEYPKFGD